MLAEAMAAIQMAANDRQNAATISMQMRADEMKQSTQRWKLMQDTQTKIFEMMQETTVHRAKTQDKLYDKWDQYVRGGG